MPKPSQAERQRKRIERLEARRLLIQSKIDILQKGLNDTDQQLAMLQAKATD